MPPPIPTAKTPELEKEAGTTYAAGRSRRVEQERTLTDAQRDEFEDMLRALTLERSQIKDAMGFTLDNADAAGEVVEVLAESLTLKETPIPTKVARLMLVSDILHNSSAPVKNASSYRTKFEAALPDIMESFNDLYRSITGRITAEALKERVLKVLQVWADWFLFSDAYVNGLRATFLRSGNSGVTPFHSISPEIEKKTSSEDAGGEGKVNEDAALAMGKGAAMKELLSLPLAELERRCRHNGLSLVGDREMMVSRLLDLEEAERQRYEIKNELTQSSSGRYRYGNEPVLAPLSTMIPIPQPDLKAFESKGKVDPVLPASKWTRDDDDDESDQEMKKSPRDLGLSYSSSGSEHVEDGLNKAEEMELTADNMNEEHRQKLRRLEIALMEYRESLEERGIKKLEEIDRKVAMHRQKLELKYGLSERSGGDSSAKKKAASLVERKDRRDDNKKGKRERSASPSARKSFGRDKEKGNSSNVEIERNRDRIWDRDSDRTRDSQRRRR